jgi:large subunit ribosomal protein L13e
MVKHNNVVASGNVKKDWQRHVKTWFNQPARKQRRRIGELPRSCLFFFSSSENPGCVVRQKHL